MAFTPSNYNGSNPVTVVGTVPRVSAWNRLWFNTKGIYDAFVTWLASCDLGVALGSWTTISYSSGNFSSSSGTFTVDSGDQVIYKYLVLGKLLYLQVQLQTTSTTG